MFDRISKTWRYLRREYPSTSTATTVGLLVGAGIATVVTAGAGAPLFIIPIAAAGGGGFCALVNGGEWDRESSNSLDINGYKIVGNQRDLSSIKMTQKLIDKKTAKLKHMTDLPEKLQRKLLKHVEDVQGALARVRVYKSGYSANPEQLGEFAFTRSCFDASGYRKEQPLAICRFVPLQPGEAAKPAVMTVPVRPEEPKKQKPPQKTPEQDNGLAASKALANGFTDLSRKVDDVARRVDRIENPPDVVLDKKKLSPK